MKKLFLVVCLLLCILIISGCQKGNNFNSENGENIDIKDGTMDDFNNEISITIDEKEYKAILNDNETARELFKLLPIEMRMNELNGNEKYYYLDKILPTDSKNPKNIKSGDIMLYGDDCLVIFYKSFDTNYAYTKVGHIDNLPDLGNDDVVVRLGKD